MDGRRRVLPLFRHLAAARASSAVQTSVGHSRNRFHSLSAIDQSVFLPKPAPIDAPLFPRQQCRYFSTSGDGDGDDDDDGGDESRDVQEQKSAFLRALEGKKHESGNTGSRRKNSAATKSNPNDNSRLRPGQRKHDNDSLLPRRPANRTNTRTKPIGGVSKKLTLDEFFANLEKPRAKGSNPKHGAPPRTPGRRGVRQGGGQGQKHSRNVGVGSRKQPRPNARRSPAGGMDSFFDDVDALMERKQREAAGAVPRASERSTENSSSDSLRSAPAFRSSIGDILLPRSSVPSAASAFGDDEGPRNFEGLGFGVESWDQYTELLEEIMEGRKFLAKLRKKKTKTAEEEDEEEKNRQVIQVVEWLRSEQPCVETDLPTLDAALKGEDRIDEANSNIKDSDSDSVTEETIAVGIDSDRSKRFREELVAQKERFMKETDWTKGQYDVATGALVALGGLCAKRCMASPLDVAWSKLKELGYPMRSKDVLHNYLYVSSTFSLPKRRATLRDDETWNLGILCDENVGDNGEGGGASAPESILDFLNKPPGSSSFGNVYRNGGEINDEIDLSAEVALCHDFFHEATEQSIGIHVRRLVHLGKANDAEKLLDASMKSNDLRLRTYGPIYQAYLDQGDVSSAFQLFVKMKGAENVLLQTETYIQLIACIAENGYFRYVTLYVL